VIELYTDGSAGPTNPGPGGWSVVSRTQPLLVGHAHHTTNIRMEGYALLEAARWLNGRPAKIHTDSQLWLRSITQWAERWELNGWVNAKGDPIANQPLVKALCAEYRANPAAELIWVRGHNGNPGNELADEWAGKARLQKLGPAGVLD
jgi:ribonuclease HI